MLTLFLHGEFVRPGDGTGDWKVASTGRLESLPYVGDGTLPEPAFIRHAFTGAFGRRHGN